MARASTPTRAAADDRLPIYQRIADEVRVQVAAGKWRPGDSIPTEAQLATLFGTAVGTVRKAIDVLEAQGLVERSHGRGTFVRRAQFDGSLFRFFRVTGPEGGRIDPQSRLLSREITAPPAEVAIALELPRAGQAIHLQRLRLTGDTPLLLEEIWLNAARFGKLLDVPEAEISPLLYPAYERMFGVVVARARETLWLDAAAERVAEQLLIEVGAPVVVIERRAVDHADKPIEVRRSYGSAGTFRYEIDVA